jgi:short-subunit dehydrogenase
MKVRTAFKGKKVLVTGGASGIGFAIARESALRGGFPVLADINREALDRAVEELRRAGLDGYPYRLDVTDIEAVREMRKHLQEKGLLPDILVNCAGVTLVAHVCNTTYEDWERMININLMGPVNITDTFMQDMIERGSGHIVNIGSIDGLIPIPGQAPYCASKFAVTGLTEVLYFDLKARGIGVTLVCPGAVNTPMAKGMPVRDFPHSFGGEKLTGFIWRMVESISNSPENIARHAAEAVEHGRFLVIPGAPSRLMWHYRRLFPRVATASGVGTAKIFDALRRLRQRQLAATSA